MNKRQFDQEFYHRTMFSLKRDEAENGVKDYPARRLAYNNDLDNYHRNDLITKTQANTWIIPKKWDKR